MNKKKKGFTLAELLVVVAILSALVAIALPLFLKQKYEANLKADQTYVKSAKAEAVAEYLAGDEDDDQGSGIDYVFDGGLSMAFRTNSTASDDIKGYGRSTKEPYNTQTGVTDDSLPVENGTSNFLKVHVKDGKATNVCWVNDKTTSCGDSGSTDQPDITPTPTPSPTTPSDKEIISIGGVEIPITGTWPMNTEDYSFKGHVEAGYIYTYIIDGKTRYFLATETKDMDRYNYWGPINDGWLSVELRTDAKVWTSNDREANGGNNNDLGLKGVVQGDLYVCGNGDVYMRRYTSSDWCHDPERMIDDNEYMNNSWVKILG